MKNEYRTLHENGRKYVVLTIKSRVHGTLEAKMDYDLFYERNVADVESWTIWKDKHGRKYARADKKNKQVLLHKRLFDTKRGCHLAFKNDDPLDCRRENVQRVDQEGNITELFVPEPVIEEKPTVLKGVTFHKASNRWNSRPYWEGVRYSLGYFPSREAAEEETRVFIREGPDSPRLKRNQKQGAP